MPNLLDRYYRFVRPYRFLYGWAKDAHVLRRASKRAQQWRERGFLGAKLDICGGRNPFRPGEYLNVDIVDFPQVDLVFDVRSHFPIPDGVVTEIMSLATLEHFRKPHIHHILREFIRVLAPGGMVRISTPDIEAIARAVLAGKDPDEWNQHLFGKYKSDDTEDYDVHRWMYTAGQMSDVLREIGFVDIERLPMDIGFHAPEYSYLLRAFKPKRP